MDLQEFKDRLARETTGITTAEAISKGICCQCRNSPEFYSEAGRKEYRITGQCEFCFDMSCDPVTCRNCSTPESWHKHGKTPCLNFDPVEA